MTIEEFKDELVQPDLGSDAFNRGVKQANSRANRLFKQVIDDFESRTCENCKYLDGHVDTILTCTNMKFGSCTFGNKVHLDFGCNMFEKH